ncbi:hypothetical protein D915_005025 [Fasciola hepatica]|uniref:DJ-1/PfpI domain-containing protein n=1 Tax=Fasciola hepatica TaxID=6192 RepID=A0A2H1CBR2_FASHE|nr:hypothetical protein D915_005025 [Fasciola hepatica]
MDSFLNHLLQYVISLLIVHVLFANGQNSTIQSALIVVPPLFDEIQVLTMADVLRRAEIQVTLAAMTNSSSTWEISGQHGLSIVADGQLPTTTEPMMDMIIIPSGFQTYDYMINHSAFGQLLKSYAASQKYVAAMGTGVGVLGVFGIYAGSQVTAHPSVESTLSPNYRIIKQDIVVDGKLFTARATVNALAFALKVVENGRSTLLAIELSSGLTSQKKLHLGVRGSVPRLIRSQIEALAIGAILLFPEGIIY